MQASMEQMPVPACSYQQVIPSASMPIEMACMSMDMVITAIKLNKDKLMRVVIDDDVDFLEKYDCMYSRKSVGRKHNHQPSSRYNERLAAHHKRSQHISSQH